MEPQGHVGSSEIVWESVIRVPGDEKKAGKAEDVVRETITESDDRRIRKGGAWVTSPSISLRVAGEPPVWKRLRSH